MYPIINFHMFPVNQLTVKRPSRVNTYVQGYIWHCMWYNPGGICFISIYLNSPCQQISLWTIIAAFWKTCYHKTCCSLQSSTYSLKSWTYSLHSDNMSLRHKQIFCLPPKIWNCLWGPDLSYHHFIDPFEVWNNDIISKDLFWGYLLQFWPPHLNPKAICKSRVELIFWYDLSFVVDYINKDKDSKKNVWSVLLTFLDSRAWIAQDHLL